MAWTHSRGKSLERNAADGELAVDDPEAMMVG